ncbi:hypothetical protein M405DRAFT_867014 [Rhizopogon salebrosus TDB-379]|nr:hypothetical protein M405DRAFT_867014 [Rhizopogon salebrosus TDB-379]
MSDNKIKLELPPQVQEFTFTFETKRPGPMMVEISIRKPPKRPRLLERVQVSDASATEPETPEQLTCWMESQKLRRAAEAFHGEAVMRRIHQDVVDSTSDTEQETPLAFIEWFNAMKGGNSTGDTLVEGSTDAPNTPQASGSRASRVALR